MILPNAALFPLAVLLARASAHWSLGCNQHSGPINLTEALETAELIPVPTINTGLSPANNGGRMTLEIPHAAHQVRTPAVFHKGHTIIEVEETRLFRGGGRAPGRFSRSQEGFFLWVEARAKALSVIERCVLPYAGEYGGWARFSIEPQGQPERQYMVRIKGTSMTNFVLRNRMSKGYDVWPELTGTDAMDFRSVTNTKTFRNVTGVNEY